MPLVWLESPKSKKLHCWRSLLATSLIVTSLVMGGRSLGVLQFWELKSYDWLLRQRPAELADSRLLIVGADETDLREYKYPLPDAVLARLIAKLEQYRPVAIGLDIFRDRPVSKDLLAAPHLVFVCAIGTNPEDAVAPPPNSPIKQIGFNDLENDRQDNMVRRHLLSRTPNAISSLSPCKTSYSFSLQLANLYLEAKNIPVKTTPQKNWQFGNVVLKRLESRSGGYQNLDARGNQLLINYRASSQIAQKLTIKQVLTDRFEPEWVRDRVVLIGVTAASIQDDRDTPYGRMRGLEVHAHIISQILSSVLDDRPLIWWLPQWGDAIWVWVWSLAGGTLVYWARSPSVGTRLRLLLALITSITGLYGLCWFFLLQGGWLPFVPALLALILTSSALAKLLP
jgi:CHASE2 domain-containing sensor protein